MAAFGEQVQTLRRQEQVQQALEHCGEDMDKCATHLPTLGWHFKASANHSSRQAWSDGGRIPQKYGRSDQISPSSSVSLNKEAMVVLYDIGSSKVLGAESRLILAWLPMEEFGLAEVYEVHTSSHRQLHNTAFRNSRKASQCFGASFSGSHNRRHEQKCGYELGWAR